MAFIAKVILKRNLAMEILFLSTGFCFYTAQFAHHCNKLAWELGFYNESKLSSAKALIRMFNGTLRVGKFMQDILSLLPKEIIYKKTGLSP